MVHTDADGASQALGLLDERRKGLRDLFLAFVERLVRLLVKRQDSRIDKITRIDADLLDPLERLERGLRLEVDVSGHRNGATSGADPLHDFLETLGVSKCGSGNANQSTTHLGQRQCLSHRLLDVLRLGSGHGLN